MNTQSNAMNESLNSPAAGPAVMSATRPLYWSVRRELWGNRWIYLAPLGVAAVFLFGFLISAVHLPGKMRALSVLGLMEQREAIAAPYDIVAGLMMVTLMIIGAFYCLEALQSERRDRSILFWKSLPVSDLTTVLSKASVPFLILPLLTFAITVATQFIMLLVSSAILLGSGQSVATLWTQLSFVQMSLLLLYHLITVHTLWPAPVYGWLLLVSAWARRAAFLWAALPVLAIAGLEKIVFHTSHVVALMGYLVSGGGAEAVTAPGGFPMDPMTHLTPGRFLSTPGLWIGLAVTVAFLAAAVRLRRYREPV
jgi:ABC-2 type transport system permease protein